MNKSMKNVLLRTLAAASCLLAGRSAFAQAYHTNDLTPPGATSGKLTGSKDGVEVGATELTSGYPHAVMLRGNALTAVDLHPVGYYYSLATCTDGVQQGGWGYANSGLVHALVWSGSSSSYADLNPSGFSFSYCLGVHNGEQVGYAQNQSYFVTASHAMLWYGSAASAVDLHTGPYTFSRAVGVHSGEQVGYISSIAYPEGESLGYHTGSHAMRWTGSAASGVDLHPTGFDASEALCTNGVQQGGWGYIAVGTSHLHALLWNGDAASVTDLHPAAYTETKILAMNDTQQVGEGWVGTPGAIGSVRHALAWSGSADTVIDLNQYLPAGYTHAVATGIDDAGNIVGYAYNTYYSGAYIPPSAVAVVFAPGAAAASGLASVAVSPADVAPNSPVHGTVSLSGPAPAGGVNVSFLSTATNLVATPGSVTIPEGETTATFDVVAGGSTLLYPTTLKIYATDGTTSRFGTLKITPVVSLSTLTLNPVEGGFATSGSIALSVPAQVGGATVSLTSGDTSLATVPASITLPVGYSALSFNVTTASVAQSTTVPVTATFNGQSVTGNLVLSPAPVLALSGVSLASGVGGQTLVGMISLNNFPRDIAGAVISLESNDRNLQVPASVIVPQGAYSVPFYATTSVVNSTRTITVTATFNGGTLSSTVTVEPIPTVVITQADYLLDTKMLKVTATTSYANSILTYGISGPNGSPIGTMQFEQGVFKGSIVLDAAPATVTVWNSVGGQVSMNVTVKTGAGGNSTNTGGTSGSTTTAQYKLVTKTVGKGTVSVSPSGSTFAAGTVVTLTATPAAGSPWIGWSGDASGTSRTITVTMTKDMTISANFK